MTTTEILIAFGGTMFFLLTGLLAWIGGRVHKRLDELTIMLDAKLGSVSASLSGIEKDLRNELTGLDRRVSRIEGREGAQ